VVKQSTENQYDDDLTVGTDSYDDSYYTEEVDLFEFSTSDESPISRLKSLILSIDWEITDEVLQQFNEELIDLKAIWAGEKINLVYVQALEKISKYIYQFKADSHPNSIKLLLTLYYNLEKIVSSDDLTEQDKKKLLLDDVKKFEKLKRHISLQKEDTVVVAPVKPDIKTEKSVDSDEQLLKLKAIVLGIDWEITDQDLNELRQEVINLEEKFSDSRPKLIFLQGIGTLGAYIKLKKSNAHADAFSVLHLFFESLEKIVTTPMSLEEEKAILFPAVEKFNAFKSLLGPTISQEDVKQAEEEDEEVSEPAVTSSDTIAPAFAGISDDETQGFQADDEAESLGDKNVDNVSSHINDFFGESSDSTPDSQIESPEESLEKVEEVEDADFVSKLEESFSDNIESVGVIDKQTALQGVDVETDDDIEDDLEQKDRLSTGVAAIFDEPVADEQEPALLDTEGEESEHQEEVSAVVADQEPALKDLEPESGLQGVDVESDADDESGELALPTIDGEVAPALVDNEEESIFSADELESISLEPSIEDEIFGKLDGFFGEDEVDASDAPSPAESLADIPEPSTPRESDPQVTEVEVKSDEIPEDDFGLEESFSAFFGDTDAEESVESGSDVEALFDSFDDEEDDKSEILEEKVTEEIDATVDDFFSLEESVEAPSEDALLFSLSEDADSSTPVELLDDGVESEEKSVVESDLDSIDSSAVDEGAELEFVEQEQFADAGEELLLFDASSEPDSVEEVDEEDVVFELVDEVEADPLPDVDVSTEEVIENTEQEQIIEAEQREELPALQETDSLQVCIQSLELDLNDEILVALLKEIDSLRLNCEEQPQKKLLLQLLSIVAQHIDQYRYEASAEAYGLLQSVNKALLGLNEENLQENEAIVADETMKILQWQQEMLARQAVRQGENLLFAEPLRTDTGLSDEDIDISQLSDEQVSSYDDLEDVERSKEDIQKEMEAVDFTEGLRSEISNLRQTLQKEIAELRKEIRDDLT